VQTPERLYYADPFLKTFSATVVEARELPGSGGEPAWRIALDRSAFYPASGGQPFDTGLLRDGSGMEIPVEQVEEDDKGAVWHYLRGGLPKGSHVEGKIDWERRFDHMQQHTGQHLLSAIFQRELQAATVSFHLGEAVSTIDLATGPLAHHSLDRIERICNEIIAEDRPVSIRYADRAEAEAMLAAGRLRKLPEREGTIRLIDIAEIDLNACGGTHVRATGQIGGLLIRRTEKVTRGVRVEFVCGMRAVRTARADAAYLNETAGLLSVGPPELADAVRRLQAENRAGARERQKLREELAIFQAAQIAAEASVENGLRLIARSWKDRDRDFVKMLASRTAAAAPSSVAIFTAMEAEPARVFLASSADLKFNAGQILKEALAQLGLRGGGSSDLAQGDVPAAQEPALRAALLDAIRRETGK
jgi:alanyl-tRNA synthetase